MIVDDEKIIRDGISTMIDWKSFDVEIVSVCKDGIEAYDMIIDEYPDIVITDIKMPGLDGLSLINQALSVNKNIEFIILSGYSEFDLARQAMKYGVRYYLLKPCNENQLIESVRFAQQEIYKKRLNEPEDRKQNPDCREHEQKDFVLAAMRYTRHNLSNPQLSLKWLAENCIYMNADYLSRRFLKETGEKYSAFLNRLRIEKAKELILQYDGDYIYRVAEQVGCGHNPQYFSQLFKKWAGCTPSQYRERYIKVAGY
jgi:two-component system response regulator YesN